jgi:predicted O-methyltransferase YrrM
MVKKLTGNASVVFRELFPDGEYAREILKDAKKYHLIIIDGEDRNNCLKYSLEKLTDDGIIIYDNSDRPDYAESFKLLAEKGFKRIDFYGMAPIVNYNSCTSVFYKNNNCLNI